MQATAWGCWARHSHLTATRLPARLQLRTPPSDASVFLQLLKHPTHNLSAGVPQVKRDRAAHTIGGNTSGSPCQAIYSALHVVVLSEAAVPKSAQLPLL